LSTALTMKEVRSAFDAAASEYEKALPAHIPTKRFVRCLTTAVQLNPELLSVDRQPLLAACQKAAEDGLLPDGREGALVIFRVRDKATGAWRKNVQWMPMLAGLLKKARNSGQISSITANVVYSNDRFRLILGDDELVEHEPFLDGDRGKPRVVYAIARLKDGGIVREWLTIAEVDKIRNASRAKDSGPWVQWYDQMAIKSCLRRLIKKLPASTDREADEGFYRAVERDDELIEHQPPKDVTPRQPARDPLDAFADESDEDLADPETGEIHEPEEPAEASIPA
jgi:recombination protein RecT